MLWSNGTWLHRKPATWKMHAITSPQDTFSTQPNSTANSRSLGLSDNFLASNICLWLTSATSMCTWMFQGSDKELRLESVQQTQSDASKQPNAMQNSNSINTRNLVIHRLVWIMGIKCHMEIQPRNDKWLDSNRGTSWCHLYYKPHFQDAWSPMPIDLW